MHREDAQRPAGPQKDYPVQDCAELEGDAAGFSSLRISPTLVADMLLNEEESLSLLRFIDASIVSESSLLTASTLTEFLDIYHGVIVRECSMAGLKAEGDGLSVYDPKSLKAMRKVIRIIHHAIEAVREVLDELGARLNDEQIRELLMEYVRTGCSLRIDKGLTAITMEALAATETAEAFLRCLLDYAPGDTPRYYVEMVLRCPGK